MWPNWKERTKELEDEILVFRAGGFPETAEKIASFIPKLAQDSGATHLIEDLEITLVTFREEFRRGNAYRDRLLRTIEPILNFMVVRFGKRQEKYTPIFRDLSRSAQNISPVARAFRPSKPGKLRYYGMCLVYLIHAEGIFAKAVAILYGLTLEALNRPIGIRALKKMSVEMIRREFVSRWDECHLHCSKDGKKDIFGIQLLTVGFTTMKKRERCTLKTSA